MLALHYVFIINSHTRLLSPPSQEHPAFRAHLELVAKYFLKANSKLFIAKMSSTLLLSPRADQATDSTEREDNPSPPRSKAPHDTDDEDPEEAGSSCFEDEEDNALRPRRSLIVQPTAVEEEENPKDKQAGAVKQVAVNG